MSGKLARAGHGLDLETTWRAKLSNFLIYLVHSVHLRMRMKKVTLDHYSRGGLVLASQLQDKQDFSGAGEDLGH